MSDSPPSHPPPPYATYMIDDDQILHDVADVENQLQVDSNTLTVNNSSFGGGTVTQQHVGQIMVGGQMMNLVTAGGTGLNIPAGSRVVVVNSGTMMDASGRVIMGTDGSEGLGVVVVNGGLTSLGSNDGGPSALNIVNTLPMNAPAGSVLPTDNNATVLMPFSSPQPNTTSSIASTSFSTQSRAIPIEKKILKAKSKKTLPSSTLSKAKINASLKSCDSKATPIPYNPMDEFSHRHHLTKTQVEGLFAIIGPHYANPGRRAPLKDFVLASLVLLSTKDSYREMSELKVFKSRGWMHKTIHLFCELMVKHLSALIEWPSGEDAKQVVKRFEDETGLPGVIGVMDSHHMALTKAPVGKSTSFYSNHMQFHSIHLFAVVDHRKKFTYVNVGRPGSFHESAVYNRTSLCQIIENEPQVIFPPNTHLIASGAFPLTDHVLTPYSNSGTLSPQQKHFNGTIFFGKNTIDQTFQLLQTRWQRLKCLEMQKVSNMIIAVKTCCILHNICMNNDAYDASYVPVDEEKSLQVEYIGAHPLSALRKRDMMANYVHSNNFMISN